jgi:Na+(H+)/acetate symporter ActP
MMGLSWGTLAGCFMGPYVLGVLWRGVTRAAAWASIISSLTLTAVLTVVLGYAKCAWSATFGQALAAGVSCSPLIGVICMAFSVVITVAVSLLTRRPSEEVLATAFDRPIENNLVCKGDTV